MELVYWSIDLSKVFFISYAEIWWRVYDWIEREVFDRPEEYRRQTYGEFWSDFKKAGLRLGDLVFIREKGEYLVAGMEKKSPGVSPIKFMRLDGAREDAFFHESYLKAEMLELRRHLPLHAMRQCQSRLRKAFADLAAPPLPKFSLP